jgi:hypothetical protein
MQEQRYRVTDRTYSAWHRRNSTRRFVGLDRAQLLAMIDLDAALYVEYDDGTKEPLALIETARDVGQPHKSASVTKNLARRAGLPCYVVLYECSDQPNPADPQWCDIKSFRIRRLWPRPESSWRTVTPHNWAAALVHIRTWAANSLDRQATNDPFWQMPQEQGRLFR